MRKQIAAGNWKMNLSADEAQSLVREIIHITGDDYQGEAEVIFGVPFPYLSLVHELLKGHSRFHLSAQNIHQEESGAYTGEVSAKMLTSVGATHAIIGHSERRQYFSESNELLARKTDRALAGGLVPIFCVGETLEQREAGLTLQEIEAQVSQGLFHLSAQQFGKLILAYEPVWAIGTGKTATPEQAQEVHAYIRKLIAGKYGDTLAAGTSILYGGSVKASNAAELFAKPDIDGGLVGGASLIARDFAEIIKAL